MSMKLTLILKIYVALALAAAIALSSLNFSFIPALLLAWFLYHWWRPLSPAIGLLTHYFLYFALTLLYSPILPAFLASLVSLPVLILIFFSLPQTAVRLNYYPTPRRRRLTGIAVALLTIAVVVLLIAAVFSNLALLLSGEIVLAALLALLVYAHRLLPDKAVEAEHFQHRILAGKEERLAVHLQSCTRVGGLLYVQPVENWTKVVTGTLSFQGGLPDLQIKVTPSLSGNPAVRLLGYVIDRWGLLQTRFELEPVELLVIPRARYAEWLAKQYLAGTKPGSLLLNSSLSDLNSRQGLRQGSEYYGNRFYQPGDSLKNISWKHSSKYRQLITKEFTESTGQPAVLLIDLTAGNAEEADTLAFNLIAAALTLAQEEVPASVAAYNHEKVVAATAQLTKSQLLLRCLQLVSDIEIRENPVRYLNPPDVQRLRSNLQRIDRVDSPSSQALAELLHFEYQSLMTAAGSSPCTRVLSEVLAKASSQSSVIILSARSHDPESLAFNSFRLTQKGIPVINLSLTS